MPVTEFAKVLAEARRAATSPGTSVPPVGPPLALGWATVDLDRTTADFARVFGVPTGAFRAVPESVALGARCMMAVDILDRNASLILLEPSTEGRLTAALARSGEGLVAVWYAASSTGDGGRGVTRPGPLGPERTIAGTPTDIPFRLVVVDGPGTIPAMTDQPAFTLRRAEPTDAASIARMFTDEGYPAGPSDIVARLGHFGSADAQVIVAEHDEALLGFVAIHLLPRFEHDDWIVRILALVVDAGARERGVGRALMAEAERIGRERGAAFVELTAGHHRPEARQLYESVGYDATVTAYLRKRL